ncbi:hypothetical protein [Clostridium sp.]|nr:hypothetical protein [Clostridium sp.]MDR3598702.1 hypothetical protein [Clostridium sp.]
MNIKTLSENIRTNIQKVIIGKDNVIVFIVVLLSFYICTIYPII